MKRITWKSRGGAYCLVALAVTTASLPSAGVALADATRDAAQRELAAAKSQFQPLGHADVQAAKKRVLEKLQVVRQRVAQDPRRAAGWLEYVLAEEIDANLRGEAMPDQELLLRLCRRLMANAAGLEEPCFRELRAVALDLLDVTAAAEAPNPGAVYQSRLESVLEALPANAGKFRSDEARKLSDRLEDLAALRQARDAVGHVRQAYLYPNFLITTPASAIERALTTEVNDPFTYRRNIAGAAVRGSGTLSATVIPRLVANDSRGEIELGIDGVSQSDTVGSREGVSIYSHNTLTFQCRPRLYLDSEQLTFTPPEVSGSLRNPITRHTNNYRRRAAAEATQRAYAEHHRSHPRAERTALADVEKNVANQLASLVGRHNAQFQENLRYPLMRAGLYADGLAISSAPERLSIAATVASDRQLAATPDRPSLDSDDLTEVVCHESLFENLGDAWLAGRTRSVADAFGLLFLPTGTDGMEEAADETLEIRLAQRHPLRVKLAKGEIHVVITGDTYSYRHGEESQESNDTIQISVGYRIANGNGRWALTRTAPPVVELGSASLRTLSRRRVLANILSREIPERIDLTQDGSWTLVEGLGPVAPSAIEIRDGWVLLGLRPA